MQLIGKTNIDFMGMKKLSFIISGIVSLIGIIAIAQIVMGSANLGIDFSGGTAVQVKLEKPFSLEAVRKSLAEGGLHDAELQEIREGNKLLVKIRKASATMGKVDEQITAAFKKSFPDNPVIVESTMEIGPSVGEKLRKDTLVAVAISMIGIIIYIAIRFDLKFGIGAAIATFHDVLAIFAVFYVLQKEVNLLLITAVLTIAGYSLTDTVVVFDRIRENLHKNLKQPLEKMFNNSINETLSRTIITSVTTFLASGSLFFFGGEVIHDFSLALMIGIGVGTYSSIFVASPVVAVLEKRAEAEKA